jgi:outer membrane cobalamin receptor
MGMAWALRNTESRYASAIIERIEVIAGASAMQGMGATGGIINYITKTPRTNGTTHAVSVRAATQFRSDNVDWKTGYAITHKDDGIRVSVLCPQAVDTAMIEGKSMNGADIDGVISADAVATAAIEGLAKETFLILPHPSVATYVAHKAANYDRWLGGMAKLRRNL